MLWGLYRLSNEILGGLHPEDPLKAPQKAQNLKHLMGGKPLVPKRKGKFNFAWSSVPVQGILSLLRALMEALTSNSASDPGAGEQLEKDPLVLERRASRKEKLHSIMNSLMILPLG